MKLRDKDNQHKLTKKQDKALAGLQNHETEDVKENWNSLKAITYDTAVNVLGKPSRKLTRIGSTAVKRSWRPC